MTPVEVVTAYFEAMATGASAAKELLALFARDAVYTEPFSGETRTHRGRDAIAAYMESSWATAPPDMTLNLDRIDIDGEVVVSLWTCSSPAFPAPVRGRDRCVVQGGLITNLEVKLLDSVA